VQYKKKMSMEIEEVAKRVCEKIQYQNRTTENVSAMIRAESGDNSPYVVAAVAPHVPVPTCFEDVAQHYAQLVKDCMGPRPWDNQASWYAQIINSVFRHNMIDDDKTYPYGDIRRRIYRIHRMLY
jgi:hypothetical protein